MLLNHIGIINKSEEQAEQFYSDFLGFEITKESVVSQELSEQLFTVSRDVKMMVFEKNGIKIEVFICPECELPSPDFSHIGLLLDNFSEITEKAPQAGIELITGKTKEKTVYFIKDFSDNLIEIKQK
jgi:catechol 2,3-dioxygenase-like lactoylglutathione lyase family enzyme